MVDCVAAKFHVQKKGTVMTPTPDLVHTVSTPDLSTELGLERATQSTIVWGVLALFVVSQVISGFPGVFRRVSR